MVLLAEECYSTEWFLSMGQCFLQKWIDLIVGALKGLPTQAPYHHDTRRSLQSLSLFDPEVNIVGNDNKVASTVQRLTSKAKRMQEEYLSDDIMDAVLHKLRKAADPRSRSYTQKMAKEQKDRIKILEKLTKVDTTKFIHKMTEEVISTAQQLQSTLSTILPPDQLKVLLEEASKKSNITLNFNNMTPYAEITDLFATLAGFLPLLRPGCLFCPGILCFIPSPEILCSEGVLTLVDELARIFSCFSTSYTETDFEDGIAWMSCLYQCR